MNIYLVIILAILIGNYILDVLVNRLDMQRQDTAIPEEFEDVFDHEEYARCRRYHLDNAWFSLTRSTVSMGFVIPFILLGGFNYLDSLARQPQWGQTMTGLLFLGLIALVFGLLDLPFAIYDTFVIEGKYGFNKTTVKTFILDMIKGVLVGILVGAPLFALIMWFFEGAGRWAPLYAWLAVTLFQVFMMLLAPYVILPLFNKFTPLEEGEVKDALEAYARDNGFRIQGIYKMDESRRSTKPNAFFTGFGKSRRIVLFDTLLEQHSRDELVAILAHEVGHFKGKHIRKALTASILETGLMFYVLSLFINNRGLFEAFSMDHLSVYGGLIFFGFLYSPLATLISTIMNVFSRKHEYEADRFALETTGQGEAMITALKKMSAETLTNLNPHPLKVFLQDSHPPVMARIRAIRELQGQSDSSPRTPGDGDAG